MRTHACRLLLVVAYLAGAGTAAGADSLIIRFTELEEWAVSRSLAASAIANSLKLSMAARDVDLQPGNPDLSLDRQKVDGSTETQITLGKSFEMPWVSLKRHSAWGDRLRSAECAAKEQTAELLGTLKAGYVSLQLLDAQLERMAHLRAVITDASHVATTRHTEGHLSGVEDHLIQMVVISLHAEYQAVRQRKRELANRWQALMGIEKYQEARLATPIMFQTITLEPVDTYLARVESQPGWQARQLLWHSLDKQSRAARAGWIHSLNLYAGYKEIEPDLDGYVAGVSLSVPLFNANRAAARRHTVERQSVSHDISRYRIQMEADIRALVSAINESQTALAHASDHFQEDREALDDLLYTYEEGMLNLNDLLSAIQIEVSGLNDYYDHLNRFYEAVFTLESITGQTLVQFE